MPVDPVNWANEFADTIDDMPSLRMMKQKAEHELRELDATRASLNGNPEHEKEWDAVFSHDARQYREAIDRIDRRMTVLRNS